MKVLVDCLGASRRWCGAECIELELPESTTLTTALDTLARHHPELAQRRGLVAVAIGDAIVQGDRILQDADRLALIPPVSGG
jgi:molybdopterin converting factor small subunit